MFRAAKALQRSTSLARPRVPTHLSSWNAGFGASSSCSWDNHKKSNETANDSAPKIVHVNPHQLLQSVYQSRGYSQYTSNGSFGRSTRGFATSAGSNDASEVDSTLEKLFQENEVVAGDPTAEPWVESGGSVVDALQSGLEFVPTWYNPADWCIRMVLQVQEMGGLEMGMAIVGTTLIVRVLLFPVVVNGQKNASRMAHVSPELKQIQKKFDKLDKAARLNPEMRLKMGQEIQATMKRYDVSFVRGMAAPFIQLPFMMGMFFGLKKMPTYFPQAFETGGMYWFPNLAVPDPTLIMPAICMVTFLGTVELGKDQMLANENGAAMIQFMRGLALLMGYVASTFDAGLVLYFTVTNVFTVGQLGVLKIPAVKKFFGIWDPPKPVPGAAQGGGGLMDAIQKLGERAQGKAMDDETKMKRHNEMVETQKRMKDLSSRRRERRRRMSRNRDE